MLNRDEMISELDLCDEMTEQLKSEIRIVEGDFELNRNETEIIKEKFPDLSLKCIGKITGEPGIILRDKKGIHPLNVHGYDHLQKR